MRKLRFAIAILIYTVTSANTLRADDGYKLWLKYNLVSDTSLLNVYKTAIHACLIKGESATVLAAKEELQNGLGGLLGLTVPQVNDVNEDGIIIVGTIQHFPFLNGTSVKDNVLKIGDEGFVISNINVSGRKTIVITANKDIGVLYGVFHFLRLLQTHQSITNLAILSSPKTKLRMLDHWDNLNGLHEYPGLHSIFDWQKLPEYIRPRYRDYARANASIGINATAVNCVNADPRFLTHDILVKVAALADVFRPYGIRVFLCPNFNSPAKLGDLKTGDPMNPEVKQWWRTKVKEIYSLIPDFGGFLVKANSEGEPGPQDFGRTQAEGCNLLAEAIKPYNGIVIWRTFVYDYNPKDRAREAYDIFKPLDGKFAENAMVQVKNGPLDFQPREPFSPLFGSMPNTPIILEVDIGMGALGQDVNLVFQAPMWREALMADTYAKGKGSTVAKIIDGSLENYKLSGMAGVANTYLENNWTGNLFGQSNWYSFGRLAWDYDITSEQIADEWIKMTFSNNPSIVDPIKKIMMSSRENVVNYMDPLGLNMLTGWGGFRGPWVNNSVHANWNSPYYHHADSIGLGFDRTKTGSNAINQYAPQVAEVFGSLEKCPEEYLLWFHHVPWKYRLKSGKTMWAELCLHYYDGVEGVKQTQSIWDSLEGRIDNEQFRSVQVLLKIQYNDAVKWRDGCVLYFQTFSRMPLPSGLKEPEHDLQYYMAHGPR